MSAEPPSNQDGADATRQRLKRFLESVENWPDPRKVEAPKPDSDAQKEREVLSHPRALSPSARKRNDRLQDIHEEEMADSQSKRSMREVFAPRVFVLVCAWLAAVLILIWLSGSRFQCNYDPASVARHPLSATTSPFTLSDNVLIALLGATGSLGLLAIVLRYAFKDGERRKKDDG